MSMSASSMSAAYRRWFPGYVSASEEYIGRALQLAKPGTKVVHLGAGRDMLGVWRRLAGRDLISVDCDPVGLGLNPNPKKILTDGVHLPMPDGSVDAILCEHVFEHLEAPSRCPDGMLSRAPARRPPIVLDS